jgi:hypothetical protein
LFDLICFENRLSLISSPGALSLGFLEIKTQIIEKIVYLAGLLVPGII